MPSPATPQSQTNVLNFRTAPLDANSHLHMSSLYCHHLVQQTRNHRQHMEEMEKAEEEGALLVQEMEEAETEATAEREVETEEEVDLKAREVTQVALVVV